MAKRLPNQTNKPTSHYGKCPMCGWNMDKRIAKITRKETIPNITPNKNGHKKMISGIQERTRFDYSNMPVLNIREYHSL